MAANDSGDVDLRVRVARARQAKQDIDSVGKSVRGLGSDVEKTNKRTRTSAKGMALFTGATNKAKTAVMGLSRAAGNAALFGVGSLVYEVFRATKGWSEHQVIVKKTTATIKSMGLGSKISAKHVGDIADSLEKLTGIDGDQIQNAANALLTFRNVSKDPKIFDRTMKAAVGLSQTPFFNGDVAGAAKTLGKALQDPVKGAAVLKKGGTLGADDLETLKKMAKAGKSVGDQQRYILKAVEKQAPPIPATPWEKLVVVLRQVEDTIGKVVLPVFNKFIRVITPPLQHLANDAAAIFSDKNLNWAERFRQLGEAVRFYFGPLANSMLQGLKDAHLDNKLKSAIIWAEPKILEGFRSVGSKAPGTMWEAFKAAPLWAEVGGGVWIARKLGLTGKAFDALRTLVAGGGKGGGVLGKLFGDRGTLANPMYVVVIAGGGKGVPVPTPGLPGGKPPGRIASKFPRAARLGGKVLRGVPVIGSVITAGEIANELFPHAGDRNLPTTGRHASPTNPAGHVGFRSGGPRRAGTESNADPYRGYSPTGPTEFVGHMARGGVVRRGGPFEVGERGRERVWLPTGAAVQPDMDKPIVIHHTTNLVVNDQVLATAVHRAATRKKSVR
jgi:hypothetical protein